jgi:hypothetical protein
MEDNMSRIKPISLALFIGIMLAGTLTAAPQPTPDSPDATSTRLPAAQMVDGASLQSRLNSTAEEWSIIKPKLDRIAMLREEVHAGLTEGTGNRNSILGMLNGMGGTSLDAPNIGGIGGIGMLMGGSQAPFDPKAAPGLNGSGGSSGRQGLAGLMMGGLGMFKMEQGSSLKALLVELKSLIADATAPVEQIKNKLAEIQAARAKAARGLDLAQKDLIPLLTTDQLAILILHGYVD